jgi:hypothetical protein
MTETTTESSNFPYGTFVVPQAIRNQYRKASLSNAYPLPEVLPMHHPILQQLEGTYPAVDTLPPWWNDCVEQCDPHVQSFLEGVTIREFRTGAADEQRWRSWKQELPESVRQALQGKYTGYVLRSPKLLSLLPFARRELFEERGGKDTPEELDLIISFRPEHFLNMSNGNGWTSCQHLCYGSVRECLPTNWYDTGVAVAMLLPRGADIWEGADADRKGVVLARTTLRVFLDPQQEQHFLISIGRPYGNNPTLNALLLSRLISLFEEHPISWSVIQCVGSISMMQGGLMGKRYKESIYTKQFVEAIAFWRPRGWFYPYVDTADGDWKDVDANRISLGTYVCRYRSILSHTPSQ